MDKGHGISFIPVYIWENWYSPLFVASDMYLESGGDKLFKHATDKVGEIPVWGTYPVQNKIEWIDWGVDIGQQFEHLTPDGSQAHSSKKKFRVRSDALKYVKSFDATKLPVSFIPNRELPTPKFDTSALPKNHLPESFKR